MEEAGERKRDREDKRLHTLIDARQFRLVDHGADLGIPHRLIIVASSIALATAADGGPLAGIVTSFVAVLADWRGSVLERGDIRSWDR